VGCKFEFTVILLMKLNSSLFAQPNVLSRSNGTFYYQSFYEQLFHSKVIYTAFRHLTFCVCKNVDEIDPRSLVLVCFRFARNHRATASVTTLVCGVRTAPPPLLPPPLFSKMLQSIFQPSSLFSQPPAPFSP